MANLYGVANPLPLPQQGNTIGATDIACPAGVETNVIAIPSNVPISQGWYYPGIFAMLDVALGATAPSTLTFGARIGAGSDFSYFALNVAVLVANANLFVPFQLFGLSTILSYTTGPLTINISVTPTANPVTCRFSGSYAYCFWNRAPDQ